VIAAALHSRDTGEPAADDPDNTPHLPLGPRREDAATGDVTAAEQMIWLAQVAAAIPTTAVTTAAARLD
jgi:hypothetical protein